MSQNRPKYMLLDQKNEEIHDKRIMRQVIEQDEGDKINTIYKEKIHSTIDLKWKLNDQSLYNIEYSNKFGLMFLATDSQIIVKTIQQLEADFINGAQSENYSFCINSTGQLFLNPDQSILAICTLSSIHLISIENLQKNMMLQQPIINHHHLDHFKWVKDDYLLGWKFQGQAYLFHFEGTNLLKEYKLQSECSTGVSIIHGHFIIIDRIVLKIYHPLTKDCKQPKLKASTIMTNDNHDFPYYDQDYMIDIFKVNYLTEKDFSANDIFGIVMVHYDQDGQYSDLRYITFAKGDIFVKQSLQMRGSQNLLCTIEKRDLYFEGKDKLCFAVKRFEVGGFICLMVQKSQTTYVIDPFQCFQKLNPYDIQSKQSLKNSGENAFQGMAVMKNMLQIQRKIPEKAQKLLLKIINDFKGQFLYLYFKDQQQNIYIPFPPSILGVGGGKLYRKYAISTNDAIQSSQQKTILQNMNKIKKSPYIEQPSCQISSQNKTINTNMKKLSNLFQSKPEQKDDKNKSIASSTPNPFISNKPTNQPESLDKNPLKVTSFSNNLNFFSQSKDSNANQKSSKSNLSGDKNQLILPSDNKATASLPQQNKMKSLFSGNQASKSGSMFGNINPFPSNVALKSSEDKNKNQQKVAQPSNNWKHISQPNKDNQNQKSLVQSVTSNFLGDKGATNFLSDNKKTGLPQQSKISLFQGNQGPKTTSIFGNISNPPISNPLPNMITTNGGMFGKDNAAIIGQSKPWLNNKKQQNIKQSMISISVDQTKRKSIEQTIIQSKVQNIILKQSKITDKLGNKPNMMESKTVSIVNHKSVMDKNIKNISQTSTNQLSQIKQSSQIEHSSKKTQEYKQKRETKVIDKTEVKQNSRLQKLKQIRDAITNHSKAISTQLQKKQYKDKKTNLDNQICFVKGFNSNLLGSNVVGSADNIIHISKIKDKYQHILTKSKRNPQEAEELLNNYDEILQKMIFFQNKLCKRKGLKKSSMKESKIIDKNTSIVNLIEQKKMQILEIASQVQVMNKEMNIIYEQKSNIQLVKQKTMKSSSKLRNGKKFNFNDQDQNDEVNKKVYNFNIQHESLGLIIKHKPVEIIIKNNTFRNAKLIIPQIQTISLQPQYKTNIQEKNNHKKPQNTKQNEQSKHFKNSSQSKGSFIEKIPQKAIKVPIPECLELKDDLAQKSAISQDEDIDLIDIPVAKRQFSSSQQIKGITAIQPKVHFAEMPKSQLARDMTKKEIQQSTNQRKSIFQNPPDNKNNSTQTKDKIEVVSTKKQQQKGIKSTIANNNQTSSPLTSLIAPEKKQVQSKIQEKKEKANEKILSVNHKQEGQPSLLQSTTQPLFSNVPSQSLFGANKVAVQKNSQTKTMINNKIEQNKGSSLFGFSSKQPALFNNIKPKQQEKDKNANKHTNAKVILNKDEKVQNSAPLNLIAPPIAIKTNTPTISLFPSSKKDEKDNQKTNNANIQDQASTINGNVLFGALKISDNTNDKQKQIVSPDALKQQQTAGQTQPNTKNQLFVNNLKDDKKEASVPKNQSASSKAIQTKDNSSTNINSQSNTTSNNNVLSNFMSFGSNVNKAPQFGGGNNKFMNTQQQPSQNKQAFDPKSVSFNGFNKPSNITIANNNTQINNNDGANLNIFQNSGGNQNQISSNLTSNNGSNNVSQSPLLNTFNQPTNSNPLFGNTSNNSIPNNNSTNPFNKNNFNTNGAKSNTNFLNNSNNNNNDNSNNAFNNNNNTFNNNNSTNSNSAFMANDSNFLNNNNNQQSLNFGNNNSFQNNSGSSSLFGNNMNNSNGNNFLSTLKVVQAPNPSSMPNNPHLMQMRK